MTGCAPATGLRLYMPRSKSTDFCDGSTDFSAAASRPGSCERLRQWPLRPASRPPWWRPAPGCGQVSASFAAGFMAGIGSVAVLSHGTFVPGFMAALGRSRCVLCPAGLAFRTVPNAERRLLRGLQGHAVERRGRARRWPVSSCSASFRASSVNSSARSRARLIAT